MSELTATTIVVEVADRDGLAVWKGLDTIQYQSTPAHTFDEWQHGEIPVDIAHQTAPIGYVTYLERRPDSHGGALMAVAVVDADPELVDGLMASPVILADAMHTIERHSYRADRSVRSSGKVTATHSTLDSIGLVHSTAGVTSVRVKAFRGDYRDVSDWGMMLAHRCPEIIERAKAATTWDCRYRHPDKLRIHQPAAPIRYETGGTALMTEYRTSTSTLEVRHAQRTIDLIAVPYDEPTEVVIRNKWVTESFRFGAFTADHSDITVNRAHDLEQPLGRVVSLDPNDRRGLRAELRISRIKAGDDVLELADEGLLAASVGFDVLPGGEQWSADRRSRTVTKARLEHIALTGDPAYKGAKVLGVRSGG